MPQWKRLEAGRSGRRSTVGGEEVLEVAAGFLPPARRRGGLVLLELHSAESSLSLLHSCCCTPTAALILLHSCCCSSTAALKLLLFYCCTPAALILLSGMVEDDHQELSTDVLLLHLVYLPG